MEVELNSIEDVKLRDLFVGHVDAEDEAALKNFSEMFYDEDSLYDRILQFPNYIISGRKGTGKTILALYIEKMASIHKEYNCELSSMGDFYKEQLKSMDYKKICDEEIELFWKWIIYLKFARSILSSHFFLKKMPFSKMKKLKKLVESIDCNNGKRYKVTGKNTKSSKTASNNFEISKDLMKLASSISDTEDLSITYAPSEYYNMVEELEKLVLYVIPFCSRQILIFDDLDEFDGRIEQNHMYRNLLLKLTKTVKKINTAIAKKEGNSKVILVLRSDIMKALNYHGTNFNKETSGCTVHLDWIKKNEKSPHNHPLMSMILSKVRSCSEEYRSLTNKELYRKLFPKKIRYKSITDYLIDYSFGRPRDIIAYLSLIQKKHGDSIGFLPEHFLGNSMEEYSRWLYKEFLNEIKVHEKNSEILATVKLIRCHGKINFTVNELNSYLKENNSDYKEISSLVDNLGILYQYGIIGNSWPKARKGKGKKRKYFYSWGYRDDADSNFDPKKHVTVHFGLRKKFSMS